MRRPHLQLRMVAAITLLATVGLGAAACGNDDSAEGGSGKVTLRLGYFPNITHGTAIVGVEKGIFAEKLGADVELKTSTFNAGPSAIEAIFSGSLDATYIGPNPTINAHSKSQGKAIRVISGGASGGAALVVKPEINGVADLRGKKIATPQLGNTQDVALRFWLKEQGLNTTKEGGGDVQVVPQENAQTVETFKTGAIDGAWVPEPWVSRLINAGGKVLLDERTLWPDGKFVVTNLIVSTTFLEKHPDVVRKLAEAQVAANDFVNNNPEEAQKAISEHIGKITGKPLDLELIKQAWQNLEFTNDPIPSSLRVGLEHAVAVGLTEPVSIDGLYDLTYLNEALRKQGQPEVPAP